MATLGLTFSISLRTSSRGSVLVLSVVVNGPQAVITVSVTPDSREHLAPAICAPSYSLLATSLAPEGL